MSAARPTEDEHFVLHALHHGLRLEEACRGRGKAGVDALAAAAVSCARRGWISKGRITEAGREVASRPCPTSRFEIVDLGSTREGSS